MRYGKLRIGFLVDRDDVTGDFSITDQPLLILKMNRTLLASGIACATVFLPISAEAASTSSLTSFGDSLSDSGNLFGLTSAFGAGFPPSPPYNERFSNGLLWIDIVQQELGLSPVLAVDLTFPPDPAQVANGINFSFAGALSSDVNVGDDGVISLPGLQDQIATFETLVGIGLPVDPTGLFTVWAGANDYTEFFADPTVAAGRSPLDIPEEATDNVVGSISKLAQLGAQNILVPNLAALGSSPFGRILDAAAPGQDLVALLNQLSAAHNQLLAAKLDAFEVEYPDVNLIELDIATLIASMIANPAAFGFTDVTTTCLPSLPGGVICSNPDEFLFWDETHPTEATHEFIAELALATLADDGSSGGMASTPEPGLVGGTLLAFGLTGLWRRRQRVASSTVAKSAA